MQGEASRITDKWLGDASDFVAVQDIAGEIDALCCLRMTDREVCCQSSAGVRRRTASENCVLRTLWEGRNPHAPKGPPTVLSSKGNSPRGYPVNIACTESDTQRVPAAKSTSQDGPKGHPIERCRVPTGRGSGRGGWKSSNNEFKAQKKVCKNS